MTRLGWAAALTFGVMSAALAATPAWRDGPSVHLKSDAMRTATLGPEPAGDYVSVTFDFAPFEAARLELETRVATKLKHRGEAHVTVVSPPEFKVLAKVLTPKEIRDAASKSFAFAKTDAVAVCVGEGIVKTDHTWFIFIEMPSATKARRELAALFEKKGGSSAEFKADEFYPHVTLGFTKRDLHLQDGVVKDLTSCRFPIRR